MKTTEKIYHQLITALIIYLWLCAGLPFFLSFILESMGIAWNPWFAGGTFVIATLWYARRTVQIQKRKLDR